MIKLMECALLNLITIIELKEVSDKLSDIVYILITQTLLFDATITVTLYLSECFLSDDSRNPAMDHTYSLPCTKEDEIKRNELSQTKSIHKSVVV